MPVQPCNVLLDSGAYSADQQNTEVNIDEYMDYIRKSDVRYYFNLDVIGNDDASWDNQRIMESNGLHPLPVYHIEDNPKYLEKCISDYKYFALGGMAGGVHENTRQRFLDTCFDLICDTPDRLPKCKVHGLGLASPILVGRYPWYCMTEENHTVLTKDGWKELKDLQEGTEILCFDDGKSMWSSIEKVITFNVKDVEINHMYNRNFNAAVTDNHSWRVMKRGRGYGWESTDTLCSNDVIKRSGKYSFRTDKVFTDEQISLLAWFWTDGTIKERPRYKHDSIVLYQSQKVNPKKCQEIRNLLIDSKEKFCEMKPTGIGIVSWELYGEITKWILNFAPDKYLPTNLPLLLTERQAKLFIKYSVMADGYKTNLVRKKGWEISVSKNYKKDNLEVLRTICLLLGIPTSISESNGYKLLRNSSVNNIYVGNLMKSKIKYSGKLWCVQVKSHAFFVKSNEHIYVTGNSIDTASGIHYGRYGIIIIPQRNRSGKLDYLIPPHSLYITERSTAKENEGAHFVNKSIDEQKWILNYVKKEGFNWGKVEVCKVKDPSTHCLAEGERYLTKHHDMVERIIEDGIVSNGILRDYFNMGFYMHMEKAIPEWPWSFKPLIRRMF